MWVRRKDLSKDQVDAMCERYYIDRCNNCPYNICNSNLCLADLKDIDLDKVKAKLNRYIDTSRHF